MKFPITSNYRASESFRNSPHNGIDFGIPSDTPLYSISDGVVSKIVLEDSGSSLGNAIFIKLENGRELVFAHLNSINVSIGEKVSTNQLIGHSGNTGNVFSSSGGDGYHLHFAVKDTNGNWINPEQYIPLIQNMGSNVVELSNNTQILDPSIMLNTALESLSKLTINLINFF